MKKSLIITAAFMMVCIASKGSLDVKTVKYDNLLVKPDINSNDSQKFWPFSMVHLVVNIIDINGAIINNEYCYGQPGTYTGLSQFYNPIGYELVGAIDNGVKLNKIQAENLIVPEFLGNSNETIDYIVKPVNKVSKANPSKSKDDSKNNIKHKNINSKPIDIPSVNSNMSHNNADKNNINKNNENKIKNGVKVDTDTTKKNSSDTKNSSDITIKKDIASKKDTQINYDEKKNSVSNINTTNKNKETNSNYSKKQKVSRNESTPFYSTRNIGMVNDKSKEKFNNQTNKFNSSNKEYKVTSSNLIESKTEKVMQSSDNLIHNESKDYRLSIKPVFSFAVPSINMSDINNSNNVQNDKEKVSNVTKKLNVTMSSQYIKNKGILIMTAVIGLISALSLAIKSKK